MATKTSSKAPAKKEADPEPAPAPAKAEKPAPAKPAPEKKQKQPAVPKPTGSEVTDRFDKPIRRLAPKDWVEKMKTAPRLNPVVGVVVFSKSEYEDPDIPLDARSFRCASDAPLFMGTGTSLDGDSLDGVDVGMTLEAMLDGPDKWEVDYCYIPEIGGFPLHPKYFLKTPEVKDQLGQFYGGIATNATAEAIIKSMMNNSERMASYAPPSEKQQRAIREAGASGLLDRVLFRSGKAQAFAKTRTNDVKIQHAVGILLEIRECPALYSDEYVSQCKAGDTRTLMGCSPEARQTAADILAEWDKANPPTPPDKGKPAKGEPVHYHLYADRDKRTAKVWGVKANGAPVQKKKGKPAAKPAAKAPAKPAKAAPAPAKARTAPDKAPAAPAPRKGCGKGCGTARKAPAKPAPAPGKAKPAPARSLAR